ncbi:MAG: sialidase family protein [Thermoplasmatota archaeon]
MGQQRLSLGDAPCGGGRPERIRSSRATLVGIVLSLVGTGSAFAVVGALHVGASIAGESTALPTFTTRAIPSIPGDEPGLAFAKDGSALLSTFSYYRTQNPLIPGQANMVIVHSSDGGVSWTNVTPPRITAPLNPNYEGDTTLTRDPATARVYSTHVTLPCMGIEATDDGGASWTPLAPYCDETTGADGIVDHPMFFLGPTPAPISAGAATALYSCIAGYEGRCGRSLDGGLSWTPMTPAFVGTNCAPTDFASGADWMSNPGAVGPDGTIYVTRSSCGHIQVAASTDLGVTWSEHEVADESPGSSVDFAPIAIATDPAGNVYMVWMNALSLPRYAVSADHGATWSTPVDLAPPTATVARFPTIVVPRPGHVAVAFWTTTTTPAAYGSSCNEVNCPGMTNALWNETLTITKDGLDPVPAFSAEQVNVGAALAKGWSLHDALGDYQTMGIAPGGALWLAHGLNCHPDSCESNDLANTDGAAIDAQTYSVIDAQTAGPLLDS